MMNEVCHVLFTVNINQIALHCKNVYKYLIEAVTFEKPCHCCKQGMKGIPGHENVSGEYTGHNLRKHLVTKKLKVFPG